jgi:X-Pro dipeptidyl-peptidase (S15 family)
MRVVACLLMAALACAAGGARADARPAWARAGHVATVPVHEAGGEVDRMRVTWFLPPGPGPFPVVLFSHGREPSPKGRAELAVGVSRAQAMFWLARGVAVVSPVRPGYGASTGRDLEAADLDFDDAGRCVGQADFRKTADAAARSVDATLRWLRRQPWADASAVLLVGQSAGGMATVAAGARDLPGVVGYVNFAGGTGGNPERSPGASCDPGQLEALYAATAARRPCPTCGSMRSTTSSGVPPRRATGTLRSRAAAVPAPSCRPRRCRTATGTGCPATRPRCGRPRWTRSSRNSVSPGMRRRHCDRSCGWIPAAVSRIYTSLRSWR